MAGKESPWSYIAVKSRLIIEFGSELGKRAAQPFILYPAADPNMDEPIRHLFLIVGWPI